MMVLEDKAYDAIRNKLLLAVIFLQDGSSNSALRKLNEARALLEGNRLPVMPGYGEVVSALALIGCGAFLGVVLAAATLMIGSEIAWRIEDRRERAALRAVAQAERRRAMGRVAVLSEHRRRA